MTPPASRMISVAIDRPADEVYAYVRNPENLPDWIVSFCRSVEKMEGDWYMNTPNGQMKIRFSDDNPDGVLDHYVTVEPGVEVMNPMRVVPRGAGCEVSFTLIQQPGMSDAQFAEDARMVEGDLRELKKVLSRPEKK